MTYARVENERVVIYPALPEQYAFTRDGPNNLYFANTVTGNFCNMPAVIHAAEGFLPFEDNPPDYDPSTHTLEKDGYEIAEDAIRQQYQLVPIPPEEIARREQEKEEIAWNAIRIHRNALLAASDWTQLTDSTRTMTWRPYRQALRDIPQTYSTPAEVIWPVPPREEQEDA